MTVQTPPPPAPYSAPAPAPYPPQLFGFPGQPPSTTHRGRWIAATIALIVALLVAIGAVISAVDEATKPAPPVGLHVVDKTATTVTLAWSAGGATEPTLYRIFRDGVKVDTTPGFKHATDVGLTPLTTYKYEVAAYADGAWSDRSLATTVTTSRASLAQAHLTGGYDVRLRVTSEYGYTHISVGDRDNLDWWFNTKRNGAVVLKGETSGGGWTMHLTQNGHRYSGQTHAVVSQCSYQPVNTAIRAHLTVRKANVVDGEWAATRFAGTVSHTAPSASAGLLTCPGAGFTSTVTGAIQR